MAEGNLNSQEATAMSEEQKKLEKAIYFFRTGDLTAWNYAILALAFLGLFLGLFLLSKNILNNRKRKMIALYQMKMSANQAEESDGKQAVVTLEKEGQQEEYTALKKERQQGDNAEDWKEPQPGDITVQWKDGQVTSLFRQVSEEDV